MCRETSRRLCENSKLNNIPQNRPSPPAPIKSIHTQKLVVTFNARCDATPECSRFMWRINTRNLAACIMANVYPNVIPDMASTRMRETDGVTRPEMQLQLCTYFGGGLPHKKSQEFVRKKSGWRTNKFLLYSLLGFDRQDWQTANRGGRSGERGDEANLCG